MKYLKTNEGLFSKDEIPKKLIDDIKAVIETKYPTEVSREGASDNNTLGYDKVVYDRVTFKSKTQIGDVLTVLTLRRPGPSVVNDYSPSRFSKKIILFEVYYDNKRYVDSDTKLNKWKDIEVISVLNNIDYVIERITKSRKSKKEVEDFYTKITVDEIKDLVADIYDILGEYEITRTTIKGSRKGFQLVFTTPVKFVHYDTNYEKGVFFTAQKKHLEVLTELNSLAKRLIDGYGLTLLYSFKNRNLKVVIFEMAPKK